MRILYSHRTRSADGQRVHIDGLTNALSTLGHEVLICGPEGLVTVSSPAKLDAGKGRSTLPKLPGHLYELMEWGYSLPASMRLMTAAKAFKPDVIYERYNLYYHAGERVARKLGLPLLLEVNAPLVDERLATGALAFPSLGKRSEKTIWQRADAVLPVTQVLGDMITAKGVSQDKIHIIPNGVEDEALALADGQVIRNQYALGDKLILGFTGFVRDWHGVDRVIDWLASENGQHAHLLLVGDGPAVPELKDQARRLNLAERFTVTGVVQRKDVAQHVAAFDIALQPAVTAYASPLKLQEYMAQQCAIIAPDQPNIRETVTNGKDAFLVPAGNTDALHTGLTKLATDHAYRRALGQQARQTMIDRDMTWSGNANRVIQIAKGLLSR